MHSVIDWLVVVAAAAVLVSCAGPASPTIPETGRRIPDGSSHHSPPGPPMPSPDSLGIPPSIPPIYVEVPLPDTSP